MIKENLYKILGLPDFASLDEIKKVYRKLAMKHHPDKEGGDEERMKLINAAYDILSKRKDEYDVRLRQATGRPVVIIRTYYGGQTVATDTTAPRTKTWTFSSGN